MKSLFAAIAAAMIAFSANADESLSKQIPARVELHAIETLTLSDQQFLTGDASGGKPATITGQFRIAQGTGRLPVVVMMHGSGGIGPNLAQWSDTFNGMGISTFVIDGLTGRGLTSVSANQALLGRLNFVLDIYRALDILAKHPRVDTSRIVLMGFSRGGQAALYASLKRFHRMWNKSGVEFAAYLPFYPDCATTFMSDTDVADRPIRIFHGSIDDTNPPATCKAYVARLRAAGHDVELTEYPGAAHSFDNPAAPNPPARSNTQSVRNCTIREDAPGQLINVATKQPFTYNDACVEQNGLGGYNPAGAQAARERVENVLKATFKLN